ncbi:hypothetical protein, partial [Pseudomonas sp. PAMC 29040]|uniref:hypothetical protein n=1 Tax=Pseudomonas sp. PAMC 29040 TaxID=2498450 RepID=UPI001C49A05C
GHSWLDWLLPAAGLALALVGTVASLGALAAPTAALTASYVTAVTTATLSVVSLAADVASIALLASGNENAGRILGWVGMATGLASAAPSMAGAAAKGVKKTGKFVGSWQHKLQHAGGAPGGGRALPGGAQRVPAMRDMDLSYLLEQGPVRESLLPHLSRGDLQNLGQTNSANRRAVYTPWSATSPSPVTPLQLPSSTPRGYSDGTYIYRPVFVTDPAYVTEVRSIISGTHPQYFPWQLGESGIQNPRQLRIVSQAQLEAYIPQRTGILGRNDRLANRFEFHPDLDRMLEVDYQWFAPHSSLQDQARRCRVL